MEMEEKVDRLDGRLRFVEQHQSSLDAKIEIMVANVDRLSQKVDDYIERTDKRLDKMDQKLEVFDNKIERLYDRMYNVVIAVGVGGVVGVGAIIATVILSR